MTSLPLTAEAHKCSAPEASGESVSYCYFVDRLWPGGCCLVVLICLSNLLPFALSVSGAHLLQRLSTRKVYELGGPIDAECHTVPLAMFIPARRLMEEVSQVQVLAVAATHIDSN
jgi:hypothetical protein